MVLDIQAGPAPLPREHGGWAMMLTPPVIAVVAAGPDLLGLMAFSGWAAAYCLRGPVEVLRGTGASGKAGMARSTPEVARLWLLIFAGLTVLLLGPVLVLRPGAIILIAIATVLLGAIVWLADRGLTRSITAGLLAVVGLMLGGPLYYLAAFGSVTQAGWILALACGAFFGGSIFRVKTLARERRSSAFRWLSVVLNVGFALAAAAAAMMGAAPWLVAAALVLPAGWSVYGAARAGEAMNLAVIGKGEQWLTISFGLMLMAGLFRF